MKRFATLSVILLLAFSCSTQQKLSRIRSSEIQPSLQLPQAESYVPELKDVPHIVKDTLKVTDLDGKEVLIMRAVRDEESGEMVATEQLQAAMVTARFRNVAERHGRVDIEFQVLVPAAMQDSRWQLRLHPDMFILEDSVRLDDILITGERYRKEQLKGYEQYERFVRRIITDTTRFVDLRNLEIFLQRNIPAIYSFRTDSTEVSDEEFQSVFGVSERQAVEHYTNKLSRRLNERRRENREKMWRRYVKVPLASEGIRLDTVLRSENGDFIYNYVQSITTRKGLRKVDMVMSGEIFEQDRRLYTIPASDPLTFYISSVAAFVDNTERYMTRVLSRRVTANASAAIEFRSGKWDIEETLSDNASEIAFIKSNLRRLLENEELELDSITIAPYASPEGLQTANDLLCLRRAGSASAYFQTYISFLRDSIRREEGYFIDISDDMKESSMRSGARAQERIVFNSLSGGENWTALDDAVASDSVLTQEQKTDYLALRASEDNMDALEKILSSRPYYRHLRDEVYPRLRSVRFDFALHRKGMVKDTVHTTELDTLYARGVQAIRDRDFETAVNILRPYQDYNTAVAYVALDFNSSAMSILKDCERTAQVNYMLSLLYAREGDDENAVQHYLHSCAQDPSYVSRGNLDPEISSLIKKYDLNAEPQDDWGDLIY